MIASGYYALIQKYKKTYIYGILLLLFIINYASFLGLYQARIKILSSEAWGASHKLILEDLRKFKNSKIHIFVNEEKSILMKYGMYNTIKNPWTLKKELMSTSTYGYTYANLTIHFSCKDILNIKPTGYYLIESKKCTAEYKQRQKNLITIKEYYSQDKSSELLYILAKGN
jgi:hypothetical protein